MHPTTFASFIATLILCWIPGGLIHLGARQHAHHSNDTDAPVAVLLETLRTNTAAMVR